MGVKVLKLVCAFKSTPTYKLDYFLLGTGSIPAAAIHPVHIGWRRRKKWLKVTRMRPNNKLDLFRAFPGKARLSDLEYVHDAQLGYVHYFEKFALTYGD